MYLIWKKIWKVHYKVKSEKLCNMQAMQELPTIKPNFQFMCTEDLRNTKHEVRYRLIVSLMISVFFKIPSVFYITYWNGNSHIMPITTSSNIQVLQLDLVHKFSICILFNMVISTWFHNIFASWRRIGMQRVISKLYWCRDNISC